MRRKRKRAFASLRTAGGVSDGQLAVAVLALALAAIAMMFWLMRRPAEPVYTGAMRVRAGGGVHDAGS